jgi:formylglycine-generating enzyme required for sulfatase activity
MIMATQSLNLVIHRRQHQNQYFDQLLDEEITLRMMLIPTGTFLMGSPEDEPDRFDSEGPQHQVSVPQFFLAKYPVTQAQWKAVAASPKVNRDLNPDPSEFEGDRRPVEQIPWADAVEFCDRLTVQTGRPYRLPNEAEWEYACRAGTTTPFHFGETITTDLANYRGIDDESIGWSGSYGSGPKGEYRQETTPVDHFDIANEFGLCEMHGNVWELCQDHWHSNYEGAPTDGSVWRDSNEDDNHSHVCRGGSWCTFPRLCRSATRAYNDDLVTFTGFRVACSAPRT